MTVDEALDLRQQTAEAAQRLAILLKALPDEVYNGAFLDEVLTLPLLKALQDPTEIKSFTTFAAFFKARRDRLAFVERMRVALHRSYAFEAKTKEGKKLFLSVSGQQWFDDGVMHTEGEREHEGFMLLLQDGVIKCATIAREAKEGDELGPEDFRYISIQEANDRQKAMPANQTANIEQPIRELEALIARQESDETQYQELSSDTHGSLVRSIRKHFDTGRSTTRISRTSWLNDHAMGVTTSSRSNRHPSISHVAMDRQMPHVATQSPSVRDTSISHEPMPLTSPSAA